MQIKKKPPEVSVKIYVFKSFAKIHRKTRVSESFGFSLKLRNLRESRR